MIGLVKQKLLVLTDKIKKVYRTIFKQCSNCSAKLTCRYELKTEKFYLECPVCAPEKKPRFFWE